MADQKQRAIRLTFSYEGNDIKLLSQQKLEMIPPPSDATEGHHQERGFWAEVENNEGATLYRRVMHKPIRPDREVFADDMDQSVSRVREENPTGVFTIVVPDLDEAENVSLHSSSASSALEMAASAEKIATFKLDK